MLGTFQLSNNTGASVNVADLNEHIFSSKVYTIHPDMLPGGTFEVYGQYTGARDTTLRVREDTGSVFAAVTGTVILTIPLIAGQGFFYTTTTYVPAGLSLIKVTTQVAAGSGTPTIQFLELAWTCVPPVPGTISVDAVELLAHDALLVTFSADMVNNAALQSPNSYTIAPVDTGIPVTVREVLTGHSNFTREVVLVFTPPSLGQVYAVATIEGLTDISGNQMAADFLSKRFQDRLTKMDSFRKNTPPIYAMTDRSTLRQVLQAVSRSDERIGGNRKDSLE